MNAFTLLEPTTVAESLAALSQHKGDVRVLAGGTDLLIQLEGGRCQSQTLLSLGRVPELRYIRWDSTDGLTIGATATLREVETHPEIVARFPSLAHGAREVGSVQIRNLATLVGNLCNASPSADTSPAVLAYDAEVRVHGPSGERVIPIGEFWLGPGQPALQSGELVTEVRLPPPPEDLRSFYAKLAVRKAMDLAMVGVCIALVPAGGGATNVRIALGAVGPTCFRATQAEAALERGGGAAIAEAAGLAADAARPIDDQRASASYRREMIRNLTERGLRRLL
jgi:carbon-monoxide dehydrogenase medium subunit